MCQMCETTAGKRDKQVSCCYTFLSYSQSFYVGRSHVCVVFQRWVNICVYLPRIASILSVALKDCRHL